MSLSTLEELADFFFEAQFLQKTPRTGFRFLGSEEEESVAEHIFLTTIIGYALAKRIKSVNAETVLKLCLFHDLAEARTGDQNYVYKQYNQSFENEAITDLLCNLPELSGISEYQEEFNAKKSTESKIANDADQLAMIIHLSLAISYGNKLAKTWVEPVQKRLFSTESRALSVKILKTDPQKWWMKNKDKSWWVTGKKEIKG